MSCTASPGISRGSVKTMAVAISSEGTATSNLRARYRLSTSWSSPRASALEPRRDEPTAVVVAEVGPVVLQRTVPHRGVHLSHRRRVVDLLGEIALDVVDDLAALRGIDRAALTDDHIGDDGIVHVTLILHLAGVVVAEEVVIAVQDGRLRPEGHRIELAVEARRDVGTVLLGVQLGIDADVLQVLHDELRVVHDDRRAVRGPADAAGETVRIAGGRQQAPGLLRIVGEVLRALAELGDGQRPLSQRGRHARWIGDADALVEGVDERLAIEGHGHRLPHPKITERLLIHAHREVVADVAGELERSEAGALALERVLDLQPVA